MTFDPSKIYTEKVVDGVRIAVCPPGDYPACPLCKGNLFVVILSEGLAECEDCGSRFRFEYDE